MNDLEQTIFAVLREVAVQRNPGLRPIERDQSLTYDLGLRSLDVAQVVATLEMELRLDPFSQLVAITSIRTVGDLCDAYRLHFDGGTTFLRSTPPDRDRGRSESRQRASELSTTDSRRQARQQAKS